MTGLINQWDLRRYAELCGRIACAAYVMALLLERAEENARREAQMQVNSHEWEHHQDDQGDGHPNDCVECADPTTICPDE